MIEPHLRKQAEDMIRGGATRGMVRKFLTDNRVSPDEAGSFVSQTQDSAAGEVRSKGMVSIAIGALLVIGGIIAFNMQLEGEFVGRSPILVIGMGIVVLAKGVITAVSGVADENA